MGKLRTEAEKYRAMGWIVLPADTKVPCVKVKETLAAYPTKLPAEWWEDEKRHPQIALITGPSRLLVLDWDGKPGQMPSLLKAEADAKRYCRSRSGSGGVHLFFSEPDRALLQAFGNGVNFRDSHYLPLEVHCNQSNITLPPSVYNSDKPITYPNYRWEYAPWEYPPAGLSPTLLAWLQKMLTEYLAHKRQRPAKTSAAAGKSSGTLFGPPAKGGHHNQAVKIAGVLTNFLPPSLREDAIYYALRGWNSADASPLPEDEIKAIVESAVTTFKGSAAEVITDENAKPTEYPDPPVDAPMPPCWKKLTDELESETYCPREAGVAMCIGMTGAIASDRFIFSSGTLDPRSYLVLLGQPESGKGFVIGSLMRHKWPQAPKIYSGVNSAEGLTSACAERHSIMLGEEEMTTFVRKTKISDSVLLPVCRTIFDVRHLERPLKKRSDWVRIEDCGVSLITGVIEEDFEEFLNSRQIDRQTLSRLFIFPLRARPTGRIGSSGVSEIVIPNLPTERVPWEPEWMPEADKVYRTFIADLDPKRPATWRMNMYFHRIATCWTVAAGRRVINLDAATFAACWCRWQITVRELFKPNAGENSVSIVENLIMDKLEKAEAAIARKTLYRMCHGERKGEGVMDMALMNLQRADRIKITRQGNMQIVEKLP